MDPWDVSVDLPIWQLVQLEVSMLKLVQMFHETGVNAICRQMQEIAPVDDPEIYIEQAIDTYNAMIEEQEQELDEFMAGDDEFEYDEFGDALDEIVEGSEDFEEEPMEPPFEPNDDDSSETLH